MTRRSTALGAVGLLAGAITLASLAPVHAGAQGPSTLTIYSSLPLHRPTGLATRDVVRGEKLALAEANGTAGGVPLRLVSLDDSTKAAGKWEPGQTSQNARRAAQDPATIAYLGEFNSGASAISIPILNFSGIPQVSPSNTYVGLTRSEGGDRGEPDKYYPAGTRTYARVAPADHIQAAAIAKYMKLTGARRAYVFHDAEIYGKGIATLVRRRLQRAGVKVVGFRAFDPRDHTPARAIRRAHFDAMFYGGITDNDAARLFNAVHRSKPRAKLFGPDGVAERAFARRLTRGAAARTRIANSTIDPHAYNARARAFVKRFRAAYHHAPEPYGIYGYEAMSLVLDAMNRAAPHANDRKAVIAAIFATRNRASVLGRYSIDAHGDTTLPLIAGYRVSRDRFLRYDRMIRAQR